ncbi:(R)-mandelonitrile lyase-like [Sesamum angolense]|uniref:(R)-mandelonitrile lyase-like n=1 Tax=Sesamum angolense TaxID=2727404 RepID=A0AAE1T4Y8_9LAMI|nr:(R)-mandelonitrile lyase-like [Sesamum angolense]
MKLIEAGNQAPISGIDKIPLFGRDLGSGTGVRVGWYPEKERFIVKGVKRKDLESAECAMEGLSDRTSGGGLPKRTGDNSTINAGFLQQSRPGILSEIGCQLGSESCEQVIRVVEKAVVFRPELRNWQSSVRDVLKEFFSLFFALFWIEAIGNEAASNVIPFASTARSVFIRNLASPLYLTAATLMEKITGPLSAGSLRLASTDVRKEFTPMYPIFLLPVPLHTPRHSSKKANPEEGKSKPNDLGVPEISDSFPKKEKGFLQKGDRNRTDGRELACYP